MLNQAMLTFWKLGYEGASITDLTVAMGITPQSLYTAFGSKSVLYHEALNHYQQTIGAFSTYVLEEETSALTGFEQMLKISAAEFCKSGRPRGCMVSMATLACAAENQDEVKYVAQLRKTAVATFRSRIDRAIDAGEFKPDTDSEALAQYLGCIIQGMSIQARDGATKQELMAIVDMAIQTLKHAVGNTTDKTH
ncbi:TetR/AcrR family transcriptional regulator [Yersinia massiliensis]|uniref:TetR/AcrR family transcriptional regulator n=1 Tax=Yersinia massiliensis TaxID=419257 RepID=UPI00031754A4|nr:TetR/AcrR family transcriptional regulator [Yersinia massiliensis]MCB5309694.1 TetR/AcrR family transcriptional regulator [Yersinia massiliensis]